MTREHFISTLRAVPSRDKEAYENAFWQVREELRRVDEQTRFEILFPVAVMAQWNAPSYPAADLLRQLSPACPLSCEDAVKALLPEWDVSIEEVPFYLASRFGPARVKEAIARLLPKTGDNDERVRLETISYWLKAYEATFTDDSQSLGPVSDKP